MARIVLQFPKFLEGPAGSLAVRRRPLHLGSNIGGIQTLALAGFGRANGSAGVAKHVAASVRDVPVAMGNLGA
jgi:hypothetical protein